jgi:hypothetical protein
MDSISELVLGSPLGFEGILAPVKITVLGSKPLAFWRAFPLNSKVQERVEVGTFAPVTFTLLVTMLGMAMTYTMPPVVVLAIRPQKFHRIYAMPGLPAIA